MLVISPGAPERVTFPCPADSSRSQPMEEDQMNAQASCRGGIDLGGTKIQAVVVDSRDAVIGQARRATPTSGGPPDVVEAMAQTLEEAAAAAGCEPSSLEGGGGGVPRPIDHDRGTLLYAANPPA